MRVILLCLPLLLVSGCFWQADEQSDLKEFVKVTQNKPRGRIEPIPTFKPYEFFNYSAAALRSPFEREKAELEEIVENKTQSTIKPDFDRTKEYLESFPVTSLRMMGTMKMANDVLYALIRDGNGSVVRVREGEYMGQNHGRIEVITEHRINLIEIVPNGSGGWLERPRTLALDGLVGE